MHHIILELAYLPCLLFSGMSWSLIRSGQSHLTWPPAHGPTRVGGRGGGSFYWCNLKRWQTKIRLAVLQRKPFKGLQLWGVAPCEECSIGVELCGHKAFSSPCNRSCDFHIPRQMRSPGCCLGKQKRATLKNWFPWYSRGHILDEILDVLSVI